MDDKKMIIPINNEYEMKKWFEKNFNKLGFSKIIRKDIGIFPDFIMEKNGKEIRVELETLSSNFILHNHDPNKVDEVVCITKDKDLPVPIKEIPSLSFVGGKERISATLDGETIRALKKLVSEEDYRNISHAIESAIKKLVKEKRGKK